MEDFQVHLLTSCPKTKNARTTYTELQKILSEQKLRNFTDLSEQEKCTYMLSPGLKDRHAHTHLPICEGRSVTDHINKKNMEHVQNALREYDEIRRAIPVNTVRIYTDGSKTDKQVGSGAIIFRNDLVLKTLSNRLINCENNGAELHAIVAALTWVSLNSNKNERKYVMFTDSRYSLDAIAEQIQTSKHHKLVEQTQDTNNTYHGKQCYSTLDSITH